MPIKQLLALFTVFILSLSSNATESKNKVYEITFSVTATPDQEKEFKDKIVPWASIKNSEVDSKRLIDSTRKVISESEATVIIDYPVRKPVNFKITSKDGFTRGDLLRRIGQIYRQMYRDEEASSTIKTVPIDKRKGLINRNATDGKYGIWGHDIDDLDISSATISCSNGKCTIDLGIES
ncbi:hypothetical protein [Undibacterium flavidum]|uniref:Uncharacterized protein n=1 Tax=Undibacterium flavidum TaxID=2762297 RepID=A0ABR6YBQ7_9BURK|nr:hypothetical protein [Undibacterium flavidum]MBC3873975.1 hypothetical protein [Undibacterium flavidum]